MNKTSLSRISMLIYYCLFIISWSWAQTSPSKVHIKDLNIRDPYIVADKQSQTYFLYKAAKVKNDQGKFSSGVVTYKSKDLETWEGPYTVFVTPPDNWIRGVIWAPEVHHYKGRYYLFATL